jgi:NAD(P)-dependent dehydrogenase (short-subunit alcohol dehydrogenase family)
VARVVILGGYGETGRRIARLLASRGRGPVVVAGRDLAKAEGLADALSRSVGRARIEPLEVDAADRAALASALEGAALLVNATSSAAPIGSVVGAALDAGVDVVDLQLVPGGAEALRRMSPEVEAADRCVVAQAGFHPGVPAALARWAGASMDEVDEVWSAGLLRARGGIPYTPAVDDLVELFRGYRAHVLEGGVPRPVRFWRADAYPRVDLAFGFGRCVTTVWDLDEVLRLGEALPGLRRAGFSIAGFDPVTDLVVSFVVMAALPFSGRRGVARLGRLLCWSTRTFARPPFGCVVQADVAGRRQDEPIQLRVALFHEDGYELTAIPAVSMIEQLLEGSVRRPGVHLMGLLVDPERLLIDVEGMGVRVLRLAKGGVRPAV